MTLSGKLAVITGGSGSIGLAIAKRYAKEGASCIIVGRNKQRLKNGLEELNRINENDIQQHQAVELDLANLNTTWDHKQFDFKFGNVDILVNAAGVAQRSLLARTSSAQIDQLLQVNLRAAIYTCKTFATPMMKRGGSGAAPCIINISSILKSNGGAGSAVYAATKAGLVGFSRALALELASRNIRVNTISPGFIDTSMTMDIPSDRFAHRCQRIGSVDHVADAAYFLATNEYCNGTDLVVDNGFSIY